MNDENLLWNIFEVSGNIDAYILYKLSSKTEEADVT
jgi:hypothetical protein